MSKLKILFIFLLISLLTCEMQETNFQGEIAYKYLQQQCQLGPRTPGTKGHKKAKNMYLEFFSQFGDTTYTQQFTRNLSYNNTPIQLTNIITEFEGESNAPLLIGAHWDTRYKAGKDPDPSKRNQAIIGANDGASGVAVLMHLAELISGIDLKRKVYLVLFDGEDQGTHGNNERWALGSKYFVNNMPIEKPREVIILDMIGDKQLSIPMERYSYNNSKGLLKKIWNIAEAKDLNQFKNRVGQRIYDDHVPFIKAGITAIDLIDFNYPNEYSNYWHTTHDTPDKCSAQSLEIVGKVIYEYIQKSP